jgi:periplasmic protein TonB
MRSSFFVILSVFVHALCVAAVAISPSRVSAPEGQEIEVQVGEAADKPGVESAPKGVTEAAAPVAPPVVEEPPIKLAKAATRKTRVVKVPMQKVTETVKARSEEPDTKMTELPPKVAVEEVQDDKLDPQIEESAPVAPVFTPVKETAPDGIEASDEQTEAGTEEAIAEDPAPEDAELAHGGATKAGAVSYLDLKQATGNKSPSYPMSARREARQGQVELVYRVTKEGIVSDLQIAKSSGHKDLDQEAARAVAQFRFVPGQEGWARHPVAFTLKGESALAPSKLRSAQAE